MKHYLTGASLIAVSTVLSATAVHAQVDQIVVTATKRTESAQDIPIAVQALGEESLDQLDVDVFTDYLQQLPGVTAGGSGPGQGTIYIRGVASSTPTLTVAGVAGLAPNVALYLDEQPVTQVGRNLDVYAVDLERVEVLSGPQGTLFGSSSQAGTIRLITNKPNLDGFSAHLSAGVSFTEGGEMSNKVEGVVNLPVTDRLALRGVFYSDQRGGFIDNVPGTRDASESGRFRPAGTVRRNGVVVDSSQNGFQAGADLSGVNFIEADNLEYVEDDFNDTDYLGFRIAALYEFNDDWRLTASHARQRIESDGVFSYDPELPDPDQLSIQRFSDDELDDSYGSTAWTLEGRLGALEALYTGAYLDRNTEQTVDYSDYLFVGQYLPYYICDASVTYPGMAAPSGNCQAPNLYVNSLTNTTVFTQELRFNTPQDKRIYATFGGFYSDQKIEERNDFTYPGSILATGVGPFTPAGATPTGVGFAPNFPLPGSLVTDPGPFPEGVIFRNDITRTDEQFALFGEATFEVVPDLLAVTGGIRWYDISVDLEGSANSSFYNKGIEEDSQLGGANLTALYDGTSSVVIDGETVDLPDEGSADGVIFKGNLTFTPTDNLLFYFTYSEGFRPPLLNRPAGAGGIVPGLVETDDLTNWEVGWKTTLFDSTLQLNGNAFIMNIDNLQTTIFDPNIVNLFFSDNAANAQVKGVEGDFIWAPYQVEGLTIAGAFSVLDTEIEEILTATTAIAPVGSDLAHAPAFQGNIRARYEWPVGDDLNAYVMPQVTYSGSSWSDIVEINRAKQDAYMLVNFSAGVSKDNWRLDFFADNLTNKRADLNNFFGYDRYRITINRPRTFGMRVSVDFE
ncbi:TonB-dependent receptor [Hyphococcus luteus]|uniref:TonB-dependent receptor n=1 Tax=Hyphococcus luteus TaxID=2058213 RepID=A0A2S7KB88_9PROT|nr:TonB-dependent receptor [Marinicaulis flavus]PQA89772.1 TonB-dependent receptor [Marinicaulis flavus]